MPNDIYILPPKSITKAISAIWLSLFISVANEISRIMMRQHDFLSEVVLFHAVTTIISIMIISFLADKLVSGRNWSRVLFSIGFVLSLLGTINKFIGMDFNLVDGGFIIARIAAYGYAIALLFSSSSREWFRQNRQPTTKTP